LAAVLLSAPSIPTGWYLDDLIHRAHFLEAGPMTNGDDMTHRMYDFLTGDPEQIHAYKDLGVLPWWADDALKIRFWRPLSSFTHVVDYRLWPDSGILMHTHSVLWLALLIAAAALLYRRLIAVPFVAGLAAVLYAIDDAHAMPVAFLANRNALIATAFGVSSLWLHDQYRRGGWTPGAVLSPLAFVAALLAGESGIGAAPYLLGYALFLERRPGLARLATIAPHALVGLAWLAYYKAGGFGTFGSGFYLDPVGEPVAWLSHFVIRAPVLLLGQWLLPPASFAFAWTPAQTAAIAAAGAVFLVVLFGLLHPILREDATARFFAFGMLLAVVPITAGFPHDRLLLFVGIGAMGLLAMLLVRLFDRSASSNAARVLGWALAVVHVLVAVPLHLMMSTAVAAQEPIYATAPRSLPDDPRLASQKLVIVNHPSAFYGQFTFAVRVFDGARAPESQLMLAPGNSTLVIERPSANALSITSANGWLTSPFDIVYRAPARTVPADYAVQLSGVRADVVATTDDGRPKQVRFTFDEELEDASLRWVVYQDGRYVPFELPAVGKTTTLDGVLFDLFAPPAASGES
jgi:hypothetical protein